jgi:DNA-binding NarL/FixJ family response regulator
LIRVMVVDDNPFVRDGLVGLLGAADDITVVAACADGDEVLEAADRAAPDVVLMDIAMRRVGGLDAIAMLHERHPDIRVVVLTGSFSPEVVRRARDRGAVGFLLKGGDPEDVLDSVRGVAGGGTAWSERAAATLTGC